MTPASAADWALEVPGPAAMTGIGRVFGEAAPAGAVLLLEGPLGVGKTTFAQGVGAGCGVDEPITSPTFNLILHYWGSRPFTHADLFRLADSRALETLDVDEIMAGEGVTCVEWPALIADRVSPPYCTLRFGWSAGGPAVRNLSGHWEGKGWSALRERLALAGAASHGASGFP
jgi:tRNA threonylcarbamoyladenosine biosynthesis protein TsaE